MSDTSNKGYYTVYFVEGKPPGCRTWQAFAVFLWKDHAHAEKFRREQLPGDSNEYRVRYSQAVAP